MVGASVVDEAMWASHAMDGKRSTRKMAPHMEIGVGNCDKIAITTQVGNYYFEEREADSEEMKKRKWLCIGGLWAWEW